MAIRGFAWLYVAIRGYTWLYVAIRGYTWLYVASKVKTPMTFKLVGASPSLYIAYKAVGEREKKGGK